MSYLGVPPFGQTVRTVTTATANGTADTFYPTGGYIVGYLDTFYNGVRVVEHIDYTASDGVSIVFATAPLDGAVIEMVSYGPISMVDAVRKSGDSMNNTLLVKDIIPVANNTYSLGNTTNRFANLYLSGNTIVLGTQTISANATTILFANSTGGAAELVLSNTGVVANNYGDSNNIPIISVNEQGRITSVSLANTASNYNTAYSNAVSVANTTSYNQAANAYANAISYTDDKAANAYANAISVANTTSYNQAANAYANVFNGGTFSGVVIMQANLTANTVRLNGDMQIDGNLIVAGNTVTMNVTSLSVEDNMIYLNASSNVANPDLGFAGNYNDGTYRHAGVFRDATDGVWKFFHQYVPEPDASAYIDTANNTFALANVQANTFLGSLVGSSVTVGNSSITITSISSPSFYSATNSQFYVVPTSASRLTGLYLDGAAGNDIAGSGTDSIMYVTKGTGNDWSFRAAHGSYDYGYNTKGTGSYAIYVQASDDAGKFRVSYSGDGIFAGNVTAYGSPSDIRLKKNILPLVNALQKIAQLNPVSFEWREDTDQFITARMKDDIGFIAQDVKNIIPELVREGEDGYLSLRDKGLIALLVKAVQELKEEVDILKGK